MQVPAEIFAHKIYGVGVTFMGCDILRYIEMIKTII